MAVGVALGIGAGALWGLTFVAPALIAPSSPLQLTLVRYGVFGLGAVIGLALLRFNPFTRLSLADWGRLALLGFCGNVLYYLAAARAIQMIGPSAVALVLGTMPVAVAVVANLRHRSVPWMRLTPPLVVITTGLAIVGITAPGIGDGAGAGSRAMAVGFALAVLGLAAWLAYAVLNAEYLGDRPGTGAMLWTFLTGVGTLMTLVAVRGAGRAGASLGPGTRRRWLGGGPHRLGSGPRRGVHRPGDIALERRHHPGAGVAARIPHRVGDPVRGVLRLPDQRPLAARCGGAQRRADPRGSGVGPAQRPRRCRPRDADPEPDPGPARGGGRGVVAVSRAAERGRAPTVSGRYRPGR